MQPFINAYRGLPVEFGPDARQVGDVVEGRWPWRVRVPFYDGLKLDHAPDCFNYLAQAGGILSPTTQIIQPARHRGVDESLARAREIVYVEDVAHGASFQGQTHGPAALDRLDVVSDESWLVAIGRSRVNI